MIISREDKPENSSTLQIEENRKVEIIIPKWRSLMESQVSNSKVENKIDTPSFNLKLDTKKEVLSSDSEVDTKDEDLSCDSEVDTKDEDLSSDSEVDSNEVFSCDPLQKSSIFEKGLINCPELDPFVTYYREQNIHDEIKETKGVQDENCREDEFTFDSYLPLIDNIMIKEHPENNIKEENVELDEKIKSLVRKYLKETLIEICQNL